MPRSKLLTSRPYSGPYLSSPHSNTTFHFNIIMPSVSSSSGAHIPGARSLWWQNSVWWRLICLGPQNGIWFMSILRWILYFWKIYAPLPQSQSPSHSRFPTDIRVFHALTCGAISQRRLQPHRCESLQSHRNKLYISLEVLTKAIKTVLPFVSLKMGTIYYSQTLVPICSLREVITP
jgi:hypothetical protein